MASNQSTPELLCLPSKTKQEEEEDERSYCRRGEFISTLSEETRPAPLRQFQGFWIFSPWLPPILAAYEHFTARASDIFLASSPKSGSTWLKSMVFSVVHRRVHPPSDEGHPLRQANPNDLIYNLEELYDWWKNPDLTALPSPRIFATHTPYSVLPEPIRDSASHIIYVAREPKDTFVSLWHFSRGVVRGRDDAPFISIDDAFDMFCSGISINGPIWEHVLEYWNEHLRHPQKVRFLKYEAMKEDPVGSLCTIAAFLGCPFSVEEEKQRVPEGISELCSFKSLSNLEVNKEGALPHRPFVIEKKLFFRRGEAGDWRNHLTSEMAEKLDGVVHEKLQGSGLSL